jgi:RNA polymerase sigma factor (sigma-70 family)
VGAATLTHTTTRQPDLDRDDVRQAAAGDGAAFERIYRRHAARIHTLSCRMLSPEEADDATQDVFIRAWQKLSLYRAEAAFGTWLYRLAINLLLARRQRLAVHRERFCGSHEDLQHAARHDRPDIRVDMEAAIQALPPGARAVFLLHDVEGHTHEEISALLTVSAGTSKSQLHRARMSLREYLQRGGSA